MDIVKLKDKGQVTIPAAIRQKLAAREGDLFEIELVNGAILLTPREIAGREKGAPARPGVDISRWIGAGRDGFKNRGEAEDFIRQERARWADR